MDDATRQALRSLNRRFYEEHGLAFSDTRRAPWPGWQRLVPHLTRLARLHTPLRVLDVGCGNGRFARFLGEHFEASGCRIAYTGVDASSTLLEQAARSEPAGLMTDWLRGDFVEDEATLPSGPFHVVVLFGVLHEVPSRAGRRALCEALVRRVARGGLLVLARWRFGELARMRRRILPWETWNQQARPPIDERQLEPGDALLPWQTPAEQARREPASADVRYAHAVDELELAALTRDLPVRRLAVFREDGREHDLNEYSILKRL